jgi:hypothetical protein
MESREAISVQSSHIFEDNTMESLDLELELNALHYNSYFDSDFDSTKGIDEFSERIIERSKPKPAKIKREISRLAEPYQPANNSATGNEKSSTGWMQSLLARFTKCPNEVIFDTGLNDGEVRVLLALNALDWNEKGWSEHSEETMASLIGKKVQFRNILTSLRKKDKVFQQRRGDHKTAKLYPKIRVEGNAVVKGYKHD